MITTVITAIVCKWINKAAAVIHAVAVKVSQTVGRAQNRQRWRFSAL
jgi:hypothetical protein